MRLCDYCQARMAVLPTLEIGQYIFCDAECAARRIAELEDGRAITEQVYAEMKGRLESAVKLMLPETLSHTTGSNETSGNNYWEFGNDARVGDWVAIRVWDMRRGIHYCADMAKITKITCLRIEVTPTTDAHPVQYWRKHGEAVANYGVRAAKPSDYDWEIYKGIKKAAPKPSDPLSGEIPASPPVDDSTSPF